MKVFNSISEFSDIKNPILTLGMFDGVPIGHQPIIKNLNQLANEIKGESILMTFERHPNVVCQKECKDLQLLKSLEEKVKSQQKYRVEKVIRHHITNVYSESSAD